MLLSCALALAPWAAYKVFYQVGPGWNGLAGACACCWAVWGTGLALDCCLATPIAFMARFRHLPWPYPSAGLGPRARDVVCGLFASPAPP